MTKCPRTLIKIKTKSVLDVEEEEEKKQALTGSNSFNNGLSSFQYFKKRGFLFFKN